MTHDSTAVPAPLPSPDASTDAGPDARLGLAADPDGAAGPETPRRRFMVIYNPTAGGARGRRLRKTLSALRSRGCQLDLRETRQRGDAEAFAIAAVGTGVDAVVVAGGDGTVNEVLNGLLRGGDGDGDGGGGNTAAIPPLGLIPLGTANVLALEIGQTLQPDSIARTLIDGPRRACALARVVPPPGDGPDAGPAFGRAEAGREGGRQFLLMGGAGFDAHVVENVKLGLKRRAGKLAYVWETLAQALRYPFPTVRGRIDGVPFEAATAVVCNGRLYGGPFIAVPEGDLAAGRLHVVLLRRKGLGNVLRYAVALALGRLPRLADVTVLAAERIDIDAPAGAALQADGDVFCRLPVGIAVAPRGIDLIVPGPAA
jgi:YegS/Rv2252/BmrU family lipid kinase